MAFLYAHIPKKRADPAPLPAWFFSQDKATMQDKTQRFNQNVMMTRVYTTLAATAGCASAAAVAFGGSVLGATGLAVMGVALGYGSKLHAESLQEEEKELDRYLDQGHLDAAFRVVRGFDFQKLMTRYKALIKSGVKLDDVQRNEWELALIKGSMNRPW